jgi:hypothetical protein
MPDARFQECNRACAAYYRVLVQTRPCRPRDGATEGICVVQMGAGAVATTCSAARRVQLASATHNLVLTLCTCSHGLHLTLSPAVRCREFRNLRAILPLPSTIAVDAATSARAFQSCDDAAADHEYNCRRTRTFFGRQTISSSSYTRKTELGMHGC